MKNSFRFLFSLLLVTSCKYEDGPLISFINAQKRIGGSYRIESVTENGIDQTDLIKSFNIDRLYFADRIDPITNEYYFFASYSNSIPADTLIYFLTEDKTQLYFNPTDTLNLPLPGFLDIPGNHNSALLWTITKLKNKEMWLTTSLNNNVYEVHLSQ